jgi:hypothetical protein
VTKHSSSTAIIDTIKANDRRLQTTSTTATREEDGAGSTELNSEASSVEANRPTTSEVAKS